MTTKCPKCEFENRAGAKFCKKCGGRLELKCPSCGSPYEPASAFCDECGRDMTGTRAPVPINYSQPQSYTPKFLADRILTTRQSIEGERKSVTVLFTDVANYTTMSEKLDSEEVRQIMDGCFKIIMDSVHKYEGTIDKFTGDGVMALFGAPLAHEDHAQRACYAAIETQSAMQSYGEKVKRDCSLDFKMRVGLNSGPVLVGGVGNDLRMDYTAVGDTVNLASRMQTMAEPGTILVSGETHRLARDFFKFQPMGKVSIKGKEQAVEAYSLIEAGGAATRLEAAMVKGLTKFIGRQKEMAALGEAFEKARSGSGQLVSVVGEAGVGKSRLLLELRRTLATQEHTCLEGRCFHYGGTIPYLPLLDILRACFDLKEGEREFVIKKKTAEKVGGLDEKLKGILPPLHELLSLKVDDEEYARLEPQKKRERIFEAIRDLLVRESQQKPLILAVDDLQWIDRTSDEFLNYFVEWLANSHILLVLLYRPEYTHSWGSKSYYSQIRVEQLPLSASAELVRAILEKGEVVPELREIILNRAAGNPLFMEEFTHTLLENGSIQKKDHQYVLTRKASEIQVPDTIQGIIAARMDRLEQNLKRTMQVASVIGRDFAYRILHAITGMQEELKSYLINLQGLEFIYEKSLFPELEYMFKHTLTQEVAYNSLLVKRRKELHAKIGEAIEELYPDRLAEFYEMLAHHYLRAENWDRAYQYLEMSAEKAMLNYSTWEAFRLGREAIAALGKLPQTEENERRGIDIRLFMTSPMLGLVYPEDSLQILEEGESLAGELNDQKSRAKFRRSIGSYCTLVKGDSGRGLQYSEGAFEDAVRAQDVELMAAMSIELYIAYSSAAAFHKAIQVSARVIESIEATDRRSDTFGLGYNPYSMLLSLSGANMAMIGDFNNGEAYCEKGLRFAQQINNAISVGQAEYAYGCLLCQKGDGRNAMPHLERAIRYAEEAQVVIDLPMAWSYRAVAHCLLGEYQIAADCAERGLEIQRKSGMAYYMSGPNIRAGIAYIDLGEVEKARVYLEEGLRLSRVNGERYAEGLALVHLGRTLGKMREPDIGQAKDLLQQGIAILDELGTKPQGSIGYLRLGELCADTGCKQEALEALNHARYAFREMGMDYWLAETEKAVEKLKG